MTAPRITHSENARQWVHVASGLFALLLRLLTGSQAAALAAGAIVFNVALLPRVGGRRLYRPEDVTRGFPLGILLYPLSVLLLMLAFPHRLDIAAAAWGILAFGDGFATLVGRSRTDKTAEDAKAAENNQRSDKPAEIGRQATEGCRCFDDGIHLGIEEVKKGGVRGQNSHGWYSCLTSHLITVSPHRSPGQVSGAGGISLRALEPRAEQIR